jgi:2',3'-cyclic-nucleotide 2'-phosphodiesterase/3'-nucleotidase
VRDLIVERIRADHTLPGTFSRNWSLLPDYVTTPQRSDIDFLVRQGVIPRAQAMKVHPWESARRGDLSYWLARSFGWREHRLSGAFKDVPDSLEPWLDGLLKRKVLGESQAGDTFRPFDVVSLGTALDWCEAAARSAGYTLASKRGDVAFRRSLMTGLALEHDDKGAPVFPDSLTRAQALTLIANLRYPEIRVLETTDFHGAILPGRDRRANRPLGGSAILAAWINRLRNENPEGTVLIDGGDLFQGTMISNLEFGRPVVEQMNALGYAASAIGNHEFDWTADTLARRVYAMHFAALGANLFQRKDGKLPKWVRADTVVMRRGVRIGILGLCYPNTPSVTLGKNVAHLRFEDDSATAAKWVPVLRRQGADAVIGVGHIPAGFDSARGVTGDLARLARGVPGVDAWFGGHSHNRVIGPVNGVPAMIAGSHGEVIGLCDLRVDPIAHKVVDRSYRLVTTYGDQVKPDADMQARVDRWNSGVGAVAAEPLGRNARLLTRTRGGESTVGNLVADAMREAAGCDIAFQNSGGLRADLPEGEVTRGAVYELMPFDNTLVTMELTGAEVKRALEDGLRGGRVTQVSGLKYSFDPSRPEMQRVVTLLDPRGAPLDSTRTWKVVVNNFMAGGGDDYTTLAHGKNTVDTQALVRDALEKLVRARCAGGATLDYKPEGRVTRIGGDGSRE